MLVQGRVDKVNCDGDENSQRVAKSQPKKK